MTTPELFLAQLEREADRTRRTVERVPEGRNDWRPHPKSMPLGYLAAHVAKLPSWVAMTIDRDEFVLDPAVASPYTPKPLATAGELVQSLDAAVAEARTALAGTTDQHLMKPWRLIVAGHVVMEHPRHLVISDVVFAHLAHHRGQLTVYLRLNDVPVPALFGPSADERGLP